MISHHYDNCKPKQIPKREITERHNFIQEHTCPHCNTVGKGPMMFRWHFEHCKHKNDDNEDNQ